MKRLLIAVSLLLGAESAALACSCVPLSGDPAQMREMARDVARNAIALVEVDVRSGYDARTRRGELMRVRRTFAGRAPRDFRIARRGPPSSAACDVEYLAGSQPLLLIYRAERPIAGGQRQFREGGLCTSLFLQNAQFRQMLIAAMRGRSASGQAPASRSASPCGNVA